MGKYTVTGTDSQVRNLAMHCIVPATRRRWMLHRVDPQHPFGCRCGLPPTAMIQLLVAPVVAMVASVATSAFLVMQTAFLLLAAALRLAACLLLPVVETAVAVVLFLLRPFMLVLGWLLGLAAAVARTLVAHLSRWVAALSQPARQRPR